MSSKEKQKPRVNVVSWGNLFDRTPYIEAIEENLDCFEEVDLYAFTHGSESRKVTNKPFDKPHTLSIVIWGSPEGCFDSVHGIERAPTAWGLDLRANCNWWAPSSEGKKIINPDSGEPIAEMGGSTLFTYPPLDIMSEGPQILAQILREICLLEA